MTKTVEIRILNRHHGAKNEYIGRGSPLGNPFIIGRDGTREQVVQAYETQLIAWIKNNNFKVITELNRLAAIAIDTGHLDLVCYCAPKACHGDVIKKVILEAIRNDKA